jgi:hypothetical protein
MQSAHGRPALLFLVAALTLSLWERVPQTLTCPSDILSQGERGRVRASAPPGAEAIPEIADARNIKTGWTIPDEGYCDQPYVVVTDDGQWLCVMTTGKGVEGQSGQHIVSTRSADRGRTWSEHVAIEPADGPEASWVMPLKVPGGRVYACYTYNADNLRAIPASSATSTAPRTPHWHRPCSAGSVRSAFTTAPCGRQRLSGMVAEGP